MFKLALTLILALFSFSLAEDFKKANEFLLKKDYDQAAALYEELAQTTKNSAVYYNLALSYYEKNENSNDPLSLAKAFYNVACAYFLSPNDGAIKNLLHQIENKQENSFDLEKFYPPSTLFLIKYAHFIQSLLALSFLIFCLVFVKKARPIKSPLFFATLLIFLLLAAFVMIKKNRLENNLPDFFIASAASQSGLAPYAVGDAFLINNREENRLAFTLDGEIHWIDKKDVLLLSMDYLKTIWSSP